MEKCKHCDKTYSSKSGLWRHTKAIHKEINSDSGNFCCREADCSFKAKTLSSLKLHLKCHGKTFPEETIEFSSMQEFDLWKEKSQKEHQVSWIKTHGSERSNDTEITRYYCNRSGAVQHQGQGLRIAKTTCKQGSFCTAKMTVRRSVETDKVSVIVCFFHYGHDVELQHLRLLPSEKIAVAKQLKDGVPPKTIIHGIRDQLGEKVERIHLTTTLDVRNIERAYGLRKERHTDDITSLRMMIKEYQELSNDFPFLRVKFQGESSADTHFSTNDMFLVLQHPFQRAVMSMFGGNGICMDSTHGTNAYGFLLISVLVLDEYGSGIPVAWCFANREDKTLLVEFLKVIKQKVGILTPTWFMSDDAGQFYSAWVEVFGSGPKKLLCSWHVDRAWSKNILIHIKDAELRKSVYETLRVLMAELDEARFFVLMQKVKEDFEDRPETRAFGEYMKLYFKRPKEWAACFRKNCINTNMHVESFHRVLKYSYLGGKCNKRLDKCVDMLLSLAKDKAMERIIKLEKRPVTSKVQQINQRHRRSSLLPLEMVTTVEEGKFVVTSASANVEYFVEFFPRCKEACAMRCSVCDICMHESSCTCFDFVIHGVVCKHIHLAHRYKVSVQGVTNSSEYQENHHGPTSNSVPVAMVIESLNSVPGTSADSTVSLIALYREIANRIEKQGSNISVADQQELRKKGMGTLNFIDLCTSTENQPVLPSDVSTPANKNITVQRQFTSIKKTKTKARKLRKPTAAETTTIVGNLLGIGSTSKKFDHDYCSLSKVPRISCNDDKLK